MDLQRPPKSAEEIDALPAFGTDECAALVRARADEFHPETLVYLLREAISAFDTSLVESCGRALIGQRDETGQWSGGYCEGIIMTVARDRGLTRDEDRLHDFRSDVHGEMWKAISAGRAEKPFWEERFGLALKHKCIDVARKHRRRAQRRESEVSVENCDADPPASVTIDDAVLGTLAERQLLDAIRNLPGRQARAAFLVWVEGRPVQGSSGDSASEIMGVSPRAVYKLLEKARAKLAEHPIIRPMLDDR